MRADWMRSLSNSGLQGGPQPVALGGQAGRSVFSRSAGERFEAGAAARRATAPGRVRPGPRRGRPPASPMRCSACAFSFFAEALTKQVTQENSGQSRDYGDESLHERPFASSPNVRPFGCAIRGRNSRSNQIDRIHPVRSVDRGL